MGLSTLMVAAGMGFGMNNAMASNGDDIKAHAAKDMGWRSADTQVSPMPGVSAQGGCQIWVASNTTRTPRTEYAYAQLKDRSFIGPRTAQADPTHGQLARLLQQCGAQADAMWWARVVNAFSGLGLGQVVDDWPSAARLRLKELGVEQHMPQLTRTGGTSVLHYFTYDMDRNITSQIVATLQANGQATLVHKPM